MRMHRAFLPFAAATAWLALSVAAPAASATKIERVISPGGIEAWLVQEKTIPLVAIDFAFEGGANQDPVEKPGVGTMAAALLDEGAGDLDARAFQDRADRNAVELTFRAQRDYLHGSLRVLRERLDTGADLLRLALTAPRFDAEPIDRIREQMLTRLRRETTNPNDIASRIWWRTGFPDHPYGRPLNGSLESVPLIVRDDLTDYARRVFARDHLKIAVVGDIDAATLAPLLDRIFGGLPEKADLRPVPPATLGSVGQKVFVELDVPQTVLSFGGLGIPRKDPDFIPAYVINHILGGGSFSSRLYREVREKRGLAYSIYSYLLPLERAALIMGGTQVRSDRADETLGLIQSEIRRLAESGPTADELEKTKSYLKGSYALGFDTSSKIAGGLVQIQLQDLGIDYIERRNDLIDKVTLEDVKRVSKRLLDGGFLVTVVGRSQAQAQVEKKQGG